jgi:hypothetical protein
MGREVSLLERRLLIDATVGSWRCSMRTLLQSLALASLIALTSLGTAHGTVGPNIDHFKCYFLSTLPGKTPVQLQDQFDPALKDVTVVRPLYLCNPTHKVHGSTTVDPMHPDEHLVCYLTKEAEEPRFQPRDVLVTNQFDNGQKVRVVRRAALLCVPSLKSLVNSPGPSGVFNTDHYRCYQVTRPNARVAIHLTDQFEDKNATVYRPILLCNPTTKVFAGNTTQPQHPDDHLVCYLTTEDFRPVFKRLVAFVSNQFVTGGQLKVVRPTNLLCVPSGKTLLP